jgi:multidrug efflux pump subunit AcrA (membrane-fusion protein)
MIRQGMTVDVDIVTKELKNVVSVGNSSVKPYQGGRAVRVPDNSKPEKFRYVPVVVGVRGTERTQVLEGIDEGQEVISTLSNENVQRPGLFGS